MKEEIFLNRLDLERQLLSEKAHGDAQSKVASGSRQQDINKYKSNIA